MYDIAKLRILHDVLTNGREVEFTYRGVPRVVEPYSIRNNPKCFKTLYLMAYQLEPVMAREHIKQFDLDKMDDLCVTERKFKPRNGWVVEHEFTDNLFDPHPNDDGVLCCSECGCVEISSTMDLCPHCGAEFEDDEI